MSKSVDDILERIIISTANQYGGYEGGDSETEHDILIAKQALYTDLMELINQPYIPTVRELTHDETPNDNEILLTVNNKRTAISLDKFLITTKIKDYLGIEDD